VNSGGEMSRRKSTEKKGDSHGTFSKTPGRTSGPVLSREIAFEGGYPGRREVEPR